MPSLAVAASAAAHAGKGKLDTRQGWQLHLNNDLWHGNQPLLQRLQQPLLATILSRVDLNLIIAISPAAMCFTVLIADSEAAYLKMRECSSQEARMW